jgi:ParB-like nuclease domain
MTASSSLQIQIWPIDRLVFYARNPRKNDAAVDRIVASIREFGFKIPVLARSDGEVVDGHLRLKAARRLEVPVILCDEWTPQQVKAFRLMVNRSVTWADWDEDLLSLELQELSAADFDLSLTGFDPGEIDGLLAIPDEERANAAPPLPENPVSLVGDLWICGKHRVLCGDATQSEDVARLLGERKPILMVTDPPYGIELDSEWRDRAGLNGHGPAEPSYMKHRTKGHTETTIRGDTRLIGPRRSSWCLACRSRTSGMPRSSRARSWMDCCASDSFTTSKSFGTRGGRFLRAPFIGSNMSRVGLFGKRTLLGTGGPARTRRSGRRLPRSSSWAALTKKSTITRPRSQWT